MDEAKHFEFGMRVECGKYFGYIRMISFPKQGMLGII